MEEQSILLTQAQAAKLLSVSRMTVYRMVKDGILHPVIIRSGERSLKRYKRSEIETIANGKVL